MVVYSFVIRCLSVLFLINPLHAVQVKPYLIPEEHPVKETLDHIFSKGHVLKSPDSLKKAGFTNSEPKAFTQLIVTTHPKIPGYIIKLYLDCQRNHEDVPEHHYWISRIQGAESVRATLDSEYFKVPKKWIYALPNVKNLKRKHYVLVEEDMELVSAEENRSLWKSALVDEELLDSLYFILQTNGLYDCAKPDNIPFSLDGKIAFVDTATHHKWPVSYNKLNTHLSSSMKRYWKRITLQ